jgi:hypothetical protein
VIRLRHGVPYPKMLDILPVSSNDLSQGLRFLCAHPLCEGGPQVEADLFKVPDGGIGGIAIGEDPVVPVVIRARPEFHWNFSCQRIFA